jgi:dihydropteroate synthase
VRVMPQIYLRPLSFIFGDDARSLIESGQAGALGGMNYIGFSKVELITRENKTVQREIISFHEVKDHPLVAEITRRRGMFGGLELNRTQIMGIVNVTPDSFSDGGDHSESETAIEHGRKLSEQGADILDIGGESTRPGSNEVKLDEERHRIMPVIKALSKDHVVSVDTRKSILMADALQVGAAIINDVSALGFDPASAATISAAQSPVILMHAQGEPRTMQLAPKYHDVALDVYDWLSERIEFAVNAGIPKSRMCVDPGIGFGKTIHHNLELLRQLSLFHGLGVGLLVGLSRKNMVGVLTGEKVAAQRVAGSVGGALQAAMMGAHILRVHDVKETVDALAVFQGALDPASTDV